jgi:hypothetical protein
MPRSAWSSGLRLSGKTPTWANSRSLQSDFRQNAAPPWIFSAFAPIKTKDPQCGRRKRKDHIIRIGTQKPEWDFPSKPESVTIY